MINKCKICKSESELNYFNINFKKYCICGVCSDTILLQSINFNLENKWKTYRELKKNG